MIRTTIEALARECGGALRTPSASITLDRVTTDSRGASPGALFIALKGQQADGHAFLADAFRNGATAALVARDAIAGRSLDPQWPLIVVPDPLHALQSLAAWQRKEYFGKVVAITGSNGKTIVKDALKALLAGRNILASPGSFNSQLGLPLAVLSAEQPVELAILEIGVSAPGEMASLERLAVPDYGILTNIGLAHLAAFKTRDSIAEEKMSLFAGIPRQGWVLLPEEEQTIETAAAKLACAVYRIGGNGGAGLSIRLTAPADDGEILELAARGGKSRSVRVKTRSPEIITDIKFAAAAAHLLGMDVDAIAERLDGYVPASTRMELWSSPQGIRIINDTHSSDPISVQAALRAAKTPSRGGRSIFVFAGMRELGAAASREHRQVGGQAAECGFNHLFLVGNGELKSTAEGFTAAQPAGKVIEVGTPDELKDTLLPMLRAGDTVLFKGPRNSGMVKAVRDLTGAMAQRCLWVNLAAVEGNVARFRRHCGAGTHVLAMLKALSYGTDLVQLASWMSRIGVHHIGVSSANEGVAARKSGADQEIYVFLCESEDLDNLLRYRLTPVIHSRELAEALAGSLRRGGPVLDVHLKVDTGMHRLGVTPEAALELAGLIRDSGTMRLTGVCTHFASADDPECDDFTRDQIARFNETLAQLKEAGFDRLLVHAANTAAAARFPEAAYDMVRIGLGLYGLYPSKAVRQALELELAIGVTSRITSVQEYQAGVSLGYSRTFTTRRKTKVGIVPFGYDDGLPWSLANKGCVLVEGQAASIVGRISMDQMQIDITDIAGANVGTEVLLYGTHNGHVLRPEEVAERAGTISHELLTRLGERVHKIYVEP